MGLFLEKKRKSIDLVINAFKKGMLLPQTGRLLHTLSTYELKLFNLHYKEQKVLPTPTIWEKVIECTQVINIFYCPRDSVKLLCQLTIKQVFEIFTKCYYFCSVGQSINRVTFWLEQYSTTPQNTCTIPVDPMGCAGNAKWCTAQPWSRTQTGIPFVYPPYVDWKRGLQWQ